jgi:SAM-dependent methyltransferase
MEPMITYKSVWNELSDSEARAKTHVLGSEKEEDMCATAEATRKKLESTVGINKKDSILEIGCGVGRVGAVLAPLCKQWIGCDVASNMLQYAAQRMARFENVLLFEVSGHDLRPVADSVVDLVYCTVVFMHLDEWDRYGYVLEARRVLCPGGRLFIDNFSLCTDEGWAIFEHHRTSFLPSNRPPHISKSSTPQELETYLHRAGFHDVQGQAQGPWIWYWGTK